MLLICLLESINNLENVTSITALNKYAVLFELLRDMIKIHFVYEQIEVKLSLSVRQFFL